MKESRTTPLEQPPDTTVSSQVIQSSPMLLAVPEAGYRSDYSD